VKVLLFIFFDSMARKYARALDTVTTETMTIAIERCDFRHKKLFVIHRTTMGILIAPSPRRRSSRILFLIVFFALHFSHSFTSQPSSSRQRIAASFERTRRQFVIPPKIEHPADTADDALYASKVSPYALPLQWAQNNLLLGIEPTFELSTIVTIYFVQGGLGLARLAQTYLLKDSLHLGPAELSALSGLFTLPWTIKPIYGFLSDGVVLFGYQRKSYLIVAGILGGLCYAFLAIPGMWEALEPETAVAGTVTALVLASACVAMSDVVADGMVVEQARGSNDPGTSGGLQSLCWGAASVGSLLSAYFSGSLLEVLSVRSVFGITAALPFLVAAMASGINEAPAKKAGNQKEKIKEQVDLLWEALKQPSIWKPTLFIFLWQATPTADGAFFFFLSNDLGLGPEFLGRVRLLTAGAGLVGVFLYQNFLRTKSIKDILFWSTIASFPLGMLPVLLITHANRALGIPDTALIFGDDVALAALGQISFIPTLVLAAKLCPPGIEAVLFATLMSVNNAAGTVGTEIGAVMTKWAGITESNFDNL
jgi:folate/biopterin transporter